MADNILYCTKPSFSTGIVLHLSHRFYGEHFTLEAYKGTFLPDCEIWNAEVKERLGQPHIIPVTHAEAQALFACCHELVIKAVPEPAIGCDGTTFYLVVESGFHSVRYTWWGELPEEWQALESITNALIEWAQAGSFPIEGENTLQ